MAKKSHFILGLSLFILISPVLAMAEAVPATMAPPSAAAGSITSSSFRESNAYKHYDKRPKSEFSKLLYLIDRLKESNFEVIYNERSYQTNKFTIIIIQYVFLNYKNETAENWIKQHAYRSRKKDCVMYLKDAAGNSHVLKDVLLEELNTLP